MKRTVSIAALMLAACGGGGGDTPPPPPPPPPPPSGSVQLTLTAPANAADGLTGSLTLAASVTGSAAAVEFQVDGVAVGSEDTSAPYAVTVDTTQWASGQHVVRARARDSAGASTEWATATVRFGGSRATHAGWSLDTAWLTGLSSATAFAQAPDGRVFVAEQGGALRVVKNGTLLATPFLTRTVDSSDERGLLGVALHPQFASNGWVYVYYTRINGGARNNRIARFTAAGDVATGGEAVSVDLPNLGSATNHNGGALKFGADGKLYVAVGDNNNGANAQDLAVPLGKMLRFNDDLSIPADNPFFATQSGLARAVWAYGLRNPFTFAVHPTTGRMHINDVGQGTWEEIDLGAAGANYGWPQSEGPDGLTGGITAPLFSYRHGATTPPGTGPGGFFTGQAIAGGAFWRGRYAFADFLGGFVAELDTANGNAAYTLAQVGGNPVDLLAAADGSLLILRQSSIARLAPP